MTRSLCLALVLATGVAHAERAPGTGAPPRLGAMIDGPRAVRMVRGQTRALERCFEAGFFTQDPTVRLDVEVGLWGRVLGVRVLDGPRDVGGCLGRVVQSLRLPRPQPARSAPVELSIGYRLSAGWRTRTVQGRLGELTLQPRAGIVIAPAERGPDLLAALPDELVQAIESRAAALRGPGHGEPELSGGFLHWSIVDAAGAELARLDRWDDRGPPNQWRLSTPRREVTWRRPRAGRPTERYQEDFADAEHNLLEHTLTERLVGGRWRKLEEVRFQGGDMKTVRFLPGGRQIVDVRPSIIS